MGCTLPTERHAFLQQLPIILFTLIGGVFADRYDRRKTLLASQYIQMFTSGTLALLMYLHVVQIGHILSVSFITSVAQSFGGPSVGSSSVPPTIPPG